MSRLRNLGSRWISVASVAACVALVACSSSPSRPKLTDVVPVTVKQEVRTVWTSRLGTVDFPLVAAVNQNRVALADGEGTVAVINAESGKDIWRTKLNRGISAGVGSDGQRVAVVTSENELVVLQDGKVQWRQTLNAQSFTPPLVAGERVFVLQADRSVLAYDGLTGRKLWTLQRAGEPLVLKQAGVLLPVKNTLVVGLSGRLVGVDPNTGVIRWESVIATSRGTNDIERLVDLIYPYHRQGDVVCVRAFQSQVGCVNTDRAQSLWTRSIPNERGIGGNNKLVIAPQSNGVIQAVHRANGERVWDTERLKYRSLSAPLVTPHGVLIADNNGWLYVLALADGELLNRVKFDGDELVAMTATADDRYILVSRDGRVSGLQIP